MTEEKALNTVYENLMGLSSITVALRNKQGLNKDKYDKTVEALNYLITLYADKKEVPKKLALCMVDIYGAFDFKEDFYSSKKEREEIEDAGIQLQELAIDLFND